MSMASIGLVALGGATGAVLRALIAALIARLGFGALPLATLAVNVLGCLAMGGLMVLFARGSLKDEHRLLLCVGLLGAFTTFSAFAQESLDMLHARRFFALGAYVLLSNALCLGAVWVGATFAARSTSAP